MARNDVYLYTNASSPAAAVVTAQQDLTAAEFPDLVLGDSPSFNFYFTDGTGTWPAFAGSGAYSVEWSLGESVAGDEPPLALQTQSTAITGGWSVRLPMLTGSLINRLKASRVSQDFPVVRLWQHLRIVDGDGYPITYALIRTNVRLRAVPDSQQLPDSPLPSGTSAVLVDASGALVYPTNFFDANQTAPAYAWAPSYYFGAAVADRTFGFFETPVAIDILGIQIAAQTAPVGSSLTVDLVDENGVELGLIGTLAAGSQYQQTTFGAAYSLAENGMVRFKVKSVGSTTPGAYLSINLLCRFATIADSEGWAFPVAVFFGTLTDEQTFGYFQARVGTEIIGVQLSAQVVPTGADVTVDLVDSSGAELSKVATLAAGESYQATDFGSALQLTASDFVRLKVKTVGSGAAGAYLTATLVTRPLTSS